MPTGAEASNEICRLTAAKLTELYKSGLLSPVDVTEAVLDRADAVDAELNVFTVINREGALSLARQSEKRWQAGEPLSPIDGVPTTIKDIVYCSGLDVRYGSSVTPDTSKEADSPSVAGLRGAGAVILGLTTTPEFGWKAITDNPTDGITRNPWDPTKTPGGSSGGAAVAAATGAGVLHLGTDGGGSIRIPASFTGVVGHKPSFGRVAAYPASSFGTVAHIGPMARTVEDVVAMLNAMAGRDVRDWTQSAIPFGDVSVAPIAWTGKRIGYWNAPCVGGVDPQIAGAVERVLKDLELAGATVEVVELPDRQNLIEVFYRHWYVGAANRLASLGNVDTAVMDPGFLKAAENGGRYSAVQRMQAELQRGRFGASMDALLQEYDFLVSPTVPILPFEAGRDVPEDSGLESWVQWSSFSFPINLSQQPACSIPCGLSTSGLPIGIQIIGARGDDAGVLSAALTYQQMYPERFQTPVGVRPAGAR